MTKFFQRPIMLRVAGFIMGLVSIFGSIAAWSYSDSREPYRYLVAAFVMFASGVLWLVSSTIPRFFLLREHYIILLSVLLLGTAFGLIDKFLFCGGECGLGSGFCHLHLGYPGRWLRISNCMAGSTGTFWWRLLRGNWRVDTPNFLAGVVFWSGIGLIVTLFRRVVKTKINTLMPER